MISLRKLMFWKKKKRKTGTTHVLRVTNPDTVESPDYDFDQYPPYDAKLHLELLPEFIQKSSHLKMNMTVSSHSYKAGQPTEPPLAPRSEQMAYCFRVYTVTAGKLLLDASDAELFMEYYSYERFDKHQSSENEIDLWVTWDAAEIFQAIEDGILTVK